MQKKYEWQVSIDDLNGEKQLGPFMAKLFEIRFNKYQEDGYAQTNKKRRMTDDDMHLIDLAKFDEDDPSQHQMKLLFGCGSEFGFRGEAEHTLACIWMVKFGRFPRGHEWWGYEYVAFVGMCDKTNKLTLKNTNVRDEEEYHRLPVIEDDPKNLGASIKRYLEKVDDQQVRLYCKPMNENSKRLYQSNGGNKRVEYYNNMPLGKATIHSLFITGAHILGLRNPTEFYPHSLRAVFITRLANDSGVSAKEIMVSARHRSAESSAAYQTTSRVSEANKFAALGMTRRTERTTATENDFQYSQYTDSDDSSDSEDEDIEFTVPTPCTQDALKYVENDVENLEKKYPNVLSSIQRNGRTISIG